MEGLWEQFTNTDVYFKLVAKDQQGKPKDPGNRMKIEAVLQGNENYQVRLLDGHAHREATISPGDEVGVMNIVFTPIEHEGGRGFLLMLTSRGLPALRFCEWPHSVPMVGQAEKQARSLYVLVSVKACSLLAGAPIRFFLSGPAMGGGKVGATHVIIDCKSMDISALLLVLTTRPYWRICRCSSRIAGCDGWRQFARKEGKDNEN